MRHEAQPSVPLSAESFLAKDDATLGALVLSTMSWGAFPASYEALGKLLRAGVGVVGVEVLERALRGRRR